MSKMRNCPFCGSDVVDLYSKTYPHPPFKLSFVECHNCGAVVSFRANERPEYTLILWNGAEAERTPEEEKAYQAALKRWHMIPSGGRVR